MRELSSLAHTPAGPPPPPGALPAAGLCQERHHGHALRRDRPEQRALAGHGHRRAAWCALRPCPCARRRQIMSPLAAALAGMSQAAFAETQADAGRCATLRHALSVMSFAEADGTGAAATAIDWDRLCPHLRLSVALPPHSCVFSMQASHGSICDVYKPVYSLKRPRPPPAGPPAAAAPAAAAPAAGLGSDSALMAGVGATASGGAGDAFQFLAQARVTGGALGQIQSKKTCTGRGATGCSWGRKGKAVPIGLGVCFCKKHDDNKIRGASLLSDCFEESCCRKGSKSCRPSRAEWFQGRTKILIANAPAAIKGKGSGSDEYKRWVQAQRAAYAAQIEEVKRSSPPGMARFWTN